MSHMVYVGRRARSGKWTVYRMHEGQMDVLGEYDSEDEAQSAKQQWEAVMVEYPEHQGHTRLGELAGNTHMNYVEQASNAISHPMDSSVIAADKLMTAIENVGNSPDLAQAKQHVEQAILLVVRHFARS